MRQIHHAFVLLAVSLASIACDNATPQPGRVSPLPDPFQSEVVDPQVSFGSHRHDYVEGSIRPSLSDTELDQTVLDFYEQWKAAHVVKGCGEGRVLVESGGGETVSEAIGYGLLASVYMAGTDDDAKALFDGLLYYYDDHVSRGLMAWKQVDCNSTEGLNSATDGDLDAAYALLLADRQWGSCHGIDYHAYATSILDALTASSVAQSRRHFLLGNWVADSSYSGAARSSDMMQGHLRSFMLLDERPIWEQILDGHYEIIDTLQTNLSRGSGLLPDFILGAGTDEPRAAPASDPPWLESEFDGAYNWNACRNPWRLALDYLLSGEERSRQAVEAINSFVIESSEGDPGGISPGYLLNGEPIEGRSYQSMAYTAPFAVGAMVNPEHQEWLDGLWQVLAERPLEGYYSDSLRLLSMLVVSGNWWAPEQFDAGCEE